VGKTINPAVSTSYLLSMRLVWVICTAIRSSRTQDAISNRNLKKVYPVAVSGSVIGGKANSRNGQKMGIHMERYLINS
jgi:hypothetical protein